MAIHGTWFVAADGALAGVWRIAPSPSLPFFTRLFRREKARVTVDGNAIGRLIDAGPSVAIPSFGAQLMELVVGAPPVAITPVLDGDRLYRVPSDALARFVEDPRSTNDLMTAYRDAVSRLGRRVDDSDSVNGFVVASVRAIARHAQTSRAGMFGWERRD